MTKKDIKIIPGSIYTISSNFTLSKNNTLNIESDLTNSKLINEIKIVEKNYIKFNGKKGYIALIEYYLPLYLSRGGASIVEFT